MLQNLLLTNLFLIANSLITISFILFAFLYLDLYIKTKKKYALYVGIGGILISLSFAGALFFEIIETVPFKNYIVLTLQFLGLLSIASGYSLEVVPTLPKGQKKSKLNSAVFPLFASFLYFANFVLAAFITSKKIHKVHYGKSNEFKPLLHFWWVMTFVLFFNMITFLSVDRFPMLELLFAQYSVFWIAIQILLLAGFVLMYRWIKLFLSFRSFTKVLFDIWSFSIILCIFVTSLFLVVNMSSYEKEITKVLRNHGNMVEFNVSQIQKSNQDILNTVISSEEVLSSFEQEDISSLAQKLQFLSVDRGSLDQLLLVSADRRIMYSSEDPSLVGNVLGGNVLVDEVLSEKKDSDDYFIQREGTITQQLVFQTALPVFKENQFLGVIVGSKTLNHSFLSSLHAFTNQEILLLDDGGSLLGYVFDQSEGFDSVVFHDTVRIDSVVDLDEEGSVFMQINNQPYLGSITEINDSDGSNVASLIVLNSYDIVASTAQNSMYLTSFYALIVSLVSFVPSYFLAKKIDKENV